MTDQQPQNGERIYARLRMRTALGGAVIFLIPFLLFTFLVRLATERYVKRQLLERLQAGASTNARLLDDVLALRAQEARSLAHTLTTNRSAPASEVLRQFVANHLWYEFAAMIEMSGVVVHSSEKVPGRVELESLPADLKPGETRIAFLARHTKKAPGEICILVGIADREPRALLLQLSSARLVSRFLDFGIAGSENTILVNRAGEILSPPRRDDWAARDRIAGSAQSAPFSSGSGTAEYRAADGTEMLAAYQLLDRGSMYLVVQVNRAEMQAPVKNLRAEVMLYVLPFLLLGVVLAVLAWRFALHYIQRLMTELYQALHVAQQREHERDLANQELARRFEQERELASQQVQFQAQLAEYEKYAALTQLALGAAHEINNPLLGILSHLELELRSTSDPERREEIQQCIEGARRIAATLRGLINYARPGPLQLSHLHLRQMVEDALAFLAHQPLFRNITLQNEIPADLPAIHADSNQISQVLMNLLLNAAQAMPKGGCITIAAEHLPSGQVEVRVVDTGTGIPEDVLTHVFEPFFTTKRGKGTGLGLSITQAFIRNHGGEISVDSQPQQGTTVRFTLPLEQPERVDETVPEVVG